MRIPDECSPAVHCYRNGKKTEEETIIYLTFFLERSASFSTQREEEVENDDKIKKNNENFH